MNAWLALPLSLRLVIVALAGGCAGMLADRWAARLRRLFAPHDRHAGRRPTPPSGVLDWIPLVGAWRGMQAAAERSRRRLAIELLAALGFAALYWWETVELALIVPPLSPRAAAPWLGAMHLPLVAHLVLATLMLAATLIDLDERIIPDEITVPGTLAGLVLVAALPGVLLPEARWLQNGQAAVETLLLSSPNGWPAVLAARPNLVSLLVAIGCFGLWCIALLPRPWRTRRGYAMAMALCWARLRRERVSQRIAVLFGLGVVGIGVIWSLGGSRWESLVTALLGMIAGGGIVWGVRIIGAATLRREAMGFGDVTLMAMIGAVLGWQATLMVFFIAPFFGIALFVAQAIASRDPEIPYGPSLCLGALAVIVRWPLLWGAARALFADPCLVPATLAVLLVLMALMLGLWGAVKRRWLAAA